MRTLVKFVTTLALLFPLFAQAVGEPYTQDKLDALNKSGKPALVFIHASGARPAARRMPCWRSCCPPPSSNPSPR